MHTATVPIVLLAWTVCHVVTQDFFILKSIEKSTQGLFGFLNKKQPRQNIVFSPLSVEVGVSMLYHGTGNDSSSRSQLQTAFSLPHPDYLQENMGDVIDSYNNISHQFTLKLGNALFVNGKSDVKPSYTAILKQSYKADTDQLRGSNVNKVDTVNSWISNQTEGLVPALLAPGSISSDTRVLLVNSLYFKGTWRTPFNPQYTHTGRFSIDKTSYVEVPTMLAESVTLAVVDKPGEVTMVKLPYTSPRFAMLLFLPAINTDINTLAENIFHSDSSLTKYTAQAREMQTKLFLPKFEITSKIGLIDALESLGVSDIFDSNVADFSEISSQPLHVGSILHSARIEVTEEGTEAAAATSIDLDLRIGGSKPFEARFDRPFLFAIMDTERRFPLFVGKITDPSDGVAERHVQQHVSSGTTEEPVIILVRNNPEALMTETEESFESGTEAQGATKSSQDFPESTGGVVDTTTEFEQTTNNFIQDNME